MGRKVTENPGYTSLASKSMPVGDFAFRFGAVRNLREFKADFRFVRWFFAGFFSPFERSATCRSPLCGW
jgi:hypothetical protein